MWMLALETSTELGSCALWRDGEITERYCPSGRSHSETLLPLVRELLADAGIAIGQLAAIAFGVGPGAFTGLRVACGAAQGLAVAADLPLVPVSSLETMAFASGGNKVFSLLDARMGEVYAAQYLNADQVPTRHGEIRVASPDQMVLPTDNGWLACGNALLAYPALAEQLQAAGLSLQPQILPTAGVLARLASLHLAAGGGIDAADAAPLYVRDKVAKTVAERLSEGGKA